MAIIIGLLVLVGIVVFGGILVAALASVGIVLTVVLVMALTFLSFLGLLLYGVSADGTIIQIFVGAVGMTIMLFVLNDLWSQPKKEKKEEGG